MSRTWALTALEFVVSWERTGEQFLPEPLFYISETRLLADSERRKRATAEELRARGGGLPEPVLACLAHPDLRITVVGADRRASGEPSRQIRMLGVRQGPTGYLVTQLPGESARRGGGFRITEGDAVELATQVVTALPAAAPGRRGEIVLPRVGFELDTAVRTRGNRFLRLPTASEGTIDVVQGSSRYGPRGIARRTLRWRDVVDDGRYALAGERPDAATAVDAKVLTAAVNNAVAQVVASIRDERT
ncbi:MULTISPECIES: ESX secretion-associated protein EspG [Nocardia]|uniref:ESX secretion-associated protein EspG n=1 Tax=Nocardia TaxID=1817 RepID=UPI001892E763|nr:MULTISPECIES: ESX secretion-associated protein EspG [Nocardia]MBF6351432.1 ESX secretion-associated protein EspG [Nocardia flavorosea]